MVQIADTNVKILVSAIDNASNVLKNIGKNLEASLGKQTQTNVAGLAGSLDTVAGSFGKVAISIAATLAPIAALVTALGFIFKATEIAGRTETLGVAMNAVARATGTSTAMLREQETQLKKQGIATQEARTILTRFMQSQLDIADASKIARVAQDLAVIAGENSSETASHLTEAIANQNVIMLRQYGIVITATSVFEGYARQLGKTAESLTSAEKKQAFVNRVLEEGQKLTGTYEKSMETFGKKVFSLDRLFQEAANAIGSAFLPIANVLVDVLSSILTAIPSTPALLAPFRALSTVIYGNIILVKQLGLLLSAIFGGIAGILMHGLSVGIEVFKSGLNDMVTTGAKQQMNLTKIWGGEVNEQTDAVKKGLANQGNEYSKYGAKIQKQLEDETYNFGRELKKRNESFEESLGDMVRAHIDKKNRFIQDIADENSDLQEKLRERVAGFKDKLAEMKADYLKNIVDIKAQMIDENDSFAESLQKKKDRFSETMESMTERHDERVLDLKRQLSRERREGDETNRAKLLNLQQELEDEATAFSKDKAKKEAENQKELTKLQTQHDKKVAAYKKELTEKETAYNEAVAKENKTNEEQTKKLQAEHDKRVAATQKQLDEELKILNANQAEVTAVSKQAVEDDIMRLKRKHEQENTEALEQHNRKLTNLKTQGTTEGAGYGGGLIDGLIPKYEELNKMATESGRKMGDNFANSLVGGIKQAGTNFVEKFLQGIVDKTQEFAKKTRTPGYIIASAFGPIGQAAWQLFGKQAGGIVPGAIGQPVPIMAHGQEEVVPFGKGRSIGGGGGNVNLNVYVGLYAGSEIEKRRIAEALYNQLVLIAGSQNKSVKDIFGR